MGTFLIFGTEGSYMKYVPVYTEDSQRTRIWDSNNVQKTISQTVVSCQTSFPDYLTEGPNCETSSPKEKDKLLLDIVKDTMWITSYPMSFIKDMPKYRLLELYTDGTVIRSIDVRVNLCCLHLRSQGLADEKVIDSPSDISGSCI